MLSSSVRETLLGWNEFLVGKRRKIVWRAGPLCIFWTVWKTRNRIAFEDEVLSTQRLKPSSLNSLWSETKLFIKDGPSTFLKFFDWVGSHYGRGCFFFLFFFFFVYHCGQFFVSHVRG